MAYDIDGRKSDRATGARLGKSISEFKTQLTRGVEFQTREQLANTLDINLHPRVRVSVNFRGSIAISSPLLPVHEILPQRTLRQRQYKRVWIDGLGVYQSFHNPIRKKSQFIVAWHREPEVKRLPISFVLRDPTPLIARTVRTVLKRSALYGTKPTYMGTRPPNVLTASLRYGKYQWVGEEYAYNKTFQAELERARIWLNIQD